MYSRSKIVITFLFFAEALFWLWLGGFIWFNHVINTYEEDYKEKTDAIVVLTGGRYRILVAHNLLNLGLAPKMFISGVPQNITLGQLLQKNGIFPDHISNIEVGNAATDTVGNAAEVADWVRKNNIKSVRLVTSNYHIPRSLAELKTHETRLKVIIHPVYSEKISFEWWRSWATFKFIFTEYNKYLFVCMRNLI